MGHGHGHGTVGTATTSASGRYAGRLALSLAILVVFLLLEVVVGYFASSLALLSDAGHMFTDVLGVGMALAAITASRRSTGNQRTFGLYRMEVLAALANAVLLFGVAAYMLFEAVRRLQQPTEVAGLPVMLTAAVGLLANLAVFALLRRGANESLNVRGASLEVLADMVGSVGVLVGGVLTTAFGWSLVDPLVAAGIGLFVLPRTWKLGKQALQILVQQAPANIDLQKVRSDLASLPSVTGVHDLHVWTLTSGMEVASAHLTTGSTHDDGSVLVAAQQVLAERYHIEHATLQVESAECAQRCRSLTW